MRKSGNDRVEENKGEREKERGVKKERGRVGVSEQERTPPTPT